MGFPLSEKQQDKGRQMPVMLSFTRVDANPSLQKKSKILLTKTV
jgi:hypothetical protein